MSDVNLELVKKRIKKLLELSQSPNENEAVAAINKANKLMEEYEISTSEIHSYIEQTVKTTKNHSSYRSCLAASICWLYSVYYYKDRDLGVYCFNGEELDVFFAVEMYTYLIDTIERMAKQNIRKKAKRHFRDSYKLGVASHIRDRIEETGKVVSWAPQRECKRKNIEVHVKSIQDISLGNPHKTLKPLNKTAFERGWIEGKNISLNRQTTGPDGRGIEYIH